MLLVRPATSLVTNIGLIRPFIMVDPGLAPASEHKQQKHGLVSDFLKTFFKFVAGTPEAGGWTTREVKRIIRGLGGLNFVYVNRFHKLCSKPHISLTNVLLLSPSGADVVEVAPAYDHADITSIAAADIVHDFLSLFVSAEPPKSRSDRQPREVEP